MERTNKKGVRIMGDGLDVGDLANVCPYANHRRDCDGDWDTYCNKGDDCPYQRARRDCDGDIIELCGW